MHVLNLSLSTGARAHFGRFHEVVDAAYFERADAGLRDQQRAGAVVPAEFAGVFSVAATEGTDPFVFDYNPNGPAEWGAPGSTWRWRGRTAEIRRRATASRRPRSPG